MLCGSHDQIWNLANHMKKQNKKMLNLLVKNWKLRVWCSLFHFFHVIYKISNSNIWSEKYFAQASCTESTLLLSYDLSCCWVNWSIEETTANYSRSKCVINKYRYVIATNNYKSNHVKLKIAFNHLYVIYKKIGTNNCSTNTDNCPK